MCLCTHSHTHLQCLEERLERDFEILSQRIAFNRSLARIKCILRIKMVWYNNNNSNNNMAILH